jgi:adenosylcobinamide-GDP ribazoletransferase
MGKRLTRFFKQLLFAFGFLTAFPGLGRISVEADDLGKSSSFFALPGLLLGAGVLLISLIPVLSPFTRSVFAVVFMLTATRGLHGDGIIDTFDGFLSGRGDRERILEVMKDSRVGALGWVGAFAVYTLKLALIAEAFTHLPEGRGFLLLLPPALSRGSVALHAFLFAPARGEGSLGRSFREGVGLREVVVSVLLMELISLGAFLSPSDLHSALLFPPGVLFFWLLWGFLCRAKIGGVTGDTMGAGIELAEIVGWAMVVVSSL